MGKRKHPHPEASAAPPENAQSGFTRRDFLKIGGLAAAVPVVSGPKFVQAAGADVACRSWMRCAINLR